MKFNGIGILGIIGTVLTIGGSIVSSIVSNKKMDETIKNEVAKQLADEYNGPAWAVLFFQK